MQSCEPPAALNVLPWPVASPKNRVGGSTVFSFFFTFQYIGQTVDTPAENGGCGYDFASGVHKYLYAADDPVDNVDPSGNDYGDFDISLASIGGLLATIGTPVTSETGLGVFSPISAKLEKLGFSYGSDGIHWDVIGDVMRTPRSRYWVVQYEKGILSVNGKAITRGGDYGWGSPLDGKWHIDDFPYLGDNNLKDGAIGLQAAEGVYMIENSDEELRYLDMPGFDASRPLPQGTTFSEDLKLKIVVYDSALNPPKEVKRSNILHLKASGTWPKINFNGP